MSAGFQLIGNSGIVQVDENYVNFALTAKGSVLPNGSAQTLPTVTGANPIICFRSPGGFTAVEFVDVAGSNFTFSIRSNATANVDWFIFDKSSLVPQTSPVGLRVYRSDGTLTYHTDALPMKIASVQQLPATPTSAGNIVVGSGSYAACLSSSILTSVGDATAGYDVRREGVQTSTTGGTSGFVAILHRPSPIVNAVTRLFLLIDVAGI